jgi:hypothetical protein
MLTAQITAASTLQILKHILLSVGVELHGSYLECLLHRSLQAITHQNLKHILLFVGVELHGSYLECLLHRSLQPAHIKF